MTDARSTLMWAMAELTQTYQTYTPAAIKTNIKWLALLAVAVYAYWFLNHKKHKKGRK